MHRTRWHSPRISITSASVLLSLIPAITVAQSINAGAMASVNSLLLLSGPVYIMLNDTGIVRAANRYNSISPNCESDIAGAQDCDDGRDATDNDDSDGYAGFSYTKLDAEGKPLEADALNWSCVRDNVTGRVWESKTDDGGIHDKDDTYQWGGITSQGTGFGIYYPDWDELVNTSNSAKLCGLSNWRVPTTTELSNLVNFNQITPSIDTVYFPKTRSGQYWTATLDARSITEAWAVQFSDGSMDGILRTNENSVRLVHSAP